jgi:spore coat polysaccharide biosynthesis protein SpsF
MVTAIIQARMGSSRLPGKVLAPVLGRPLLWHMVQRLRRSSRVQQIVIATTDKAIDRQIVTLAESLNVCVVTGSETDVLDRVYQAAIVAKADPVVRLTADCPLIDPELVDRVVSAFTADDVDYASLAETYPDGLDTEVFSFGVLACVWREARLPSDREHVTSFIRKHPDRFRMLEIPSEQDWTDVRWTVDEPRDLDLIQQIFCELYQGNQAFSFFEVLQLMVRRPELCQINHGIQRNQGYQTSLERDVA